MENIDLDSCLKETVDVFDLNLSQNELLFSQTHSCDFEYLVTLYSSAVEKMANSNFSHLTSLYPSHLKFASKPQNDSPYISGISTNINPKHCFHTFLKHEYSEIIKLRNQIFEKHSKMFSKKNSTFIFWNAVMNLDDDLWHRFELAFSSFSDSSAVYDIPSEPSNPFTMTSLLSIFDRLNLFMSVTLSSPHLTERRLSTLNETLSVYFADTIVTETPTDNSNNTESDSNHSTGKIVGVVIGVILAIAAIVFLLRFLHKRQFKNKEKDKKVDEEEGEISSEDVKESSPSAEEIEKRQSQIQGGSVAARSSSGVPPPPPPRKSQEKQKEEKMDFELEEQYEEQKSEKDDEKSSSSSSSSQAEIRASAVVIGRLHSDNNISEEDRDFFNSNEKNSDATMHRASIQLEKDDFDDVPRRSVLKSESGEFFFEETHKSSNLIDENASFSNEDNDKKSEKGENVEKSETVIVFEPVVHEKEEEKNISLSESKRSFNLEKQALLDFL
eukprot:GDKJ01026412.1.p1 GENE.GDKJ01026412.1~~GDKJ01026412.1.p1  ORF type:complete len:561 (+),score=141.56 GDKJ01026412.1:187-1683(+)